MRSITDRVIRTFIHIILQPLRTEHLGCLLEDKGGRCVGLTFLYRLSRNSGGSFPEARRVCPDPYRYSFYFYMEYYDKNVLQGILESLCRLFENSLATWIGTNAARLMGSQQVRKIMRPVSDVPRGVLNPTPHPRNSEILTKSNRIAN